MNDETSRDIEALIVDLQARQTVTEMIQTHFMVQLIGQLAERPPEFLRQIMIRVEDSLRDGAKAAPADQREIAQAAIAAFEARSHDLITALTPKKRPQ